MVEKHGGVPYCLNFITVSRVQISGVFDDKARIIFLICR